jgi:ATP-dependent Clp protease ATP-binding subunit ClpC
MLTFDPECQAAVDLAKRTVPEGQALGVGHLIATLFYRGNLAASLPSLAARIPEVTPLRDSVPEKVPLTDGLKPILRRLIRHAPPVTCSELFLALASSETGREFLRHHGATSDEIDAALAALDPPPKPDSAPQSAPNATPTAWRHSPQRAHAMQTLQSFGRMLTESELPVRTVVEREETLATLVKILSRMGRRNAIVLGFPGTGKTAIVYELARRIRRGDSSLPERLRDADIFELSPTFLRSGAKVVGEYEERVSTLITALRDCPKIILFVDEIHSLLQSSVYDRGPFSDANEAFKAALGRNEITCIGCTTPSEYRRFIEPDRALVRRFGLVWTDPPARESTLAILTARRPRAEAHYAPLRIPDQILERVVSLTDEYLPALFQPDKSIQLLDAACAACAIAQPLLPEVTEDALIESLADLVGHPIATSRHLTEQSVFQRLCADILGQDEPLRDVAHAFVAGLDQFLRDPRDSRPRGVLLFGGPTGVGKTQVALVLAEILGGGHESLIRIDCSTLQGSGYDSGPAINRLLGVPPGYVGYARGQGGTLSRVRDHPESIVLFDEFEKADPGVGELLLRILDEGRVEDVDGNLLDFRRTYVIFTSNAGCVYESRRTPGFSQSDVRRQTGPRVTAVSLWQELRAVGLGEEFRNRIPHVILFRALEPDTIRAIIALHLAHLARKAAAQGIALVWDGPTISYLAGYWDQRLGARNIKAIVRIAVEEQLKVAHVAGELEGITRVELSVGAANDATRLTLPGEGATRRRTDHTLVIVFPASPMESRHGADDG